MSVAVISAKLWSYLPVLLLTISMVIGVPIAIRYYRQVREDDDPIRDADLLADLEQGDAASLMTNDEFRRVRALLGGSETRRDVKARAKPAWSKPDTAGAARDQEAPIRIEHREGREEESPEGRPKIDGEHELAG